MTGPPDLRYRNKLKAKYSKLQLKYQHSLQVGIPYRIALRNRSSYCIQVQTDLTQELREKEGKLSKLQDEVESVTPFQPSSCSVVPSTDSCVDSLIIDQIHHSDYAHLAPKQPTLFADPLSSATSHTPAPRHVIPAPPSQLPAAAEPIQRPQQLDYPTNYDSVTEAAISTTHSRIRKERSPEEEISAKRARTDAA